MAAAAQSTYLRRRGEEAGTGAGLARELGRPQRAGRGKRSPSHPQAGGGAYGYLLGRPGGRSRVRLGGSNIPAGQGGVPRACHPGAGPAPVPAFPDGRQENCRVTELRAAQSDAGGRERATPGLQRRAESKARR